MNFATESILDSIMKKKKLAKKTRMTEYFLGQYKSETFWKEYAQAKEAHTKRSADKKQFFKSKKVQGIDIPYYEIVYDDGTLCDLTGRPRRAAIHYVCQPDGRGEIYELKETSSCEYEVVVLTSLLCPHTAYGPKKEHVNVIHCHSLDGSPRQPQNIEMFENSRWRYNSKEDDDDDEDEALTSTKPQKPKEPAKSSLPPVDLKVSSQIGEYTDKQILKEFLAGDFCIHGGTGWWKYEFCYGRHILQYHEDKGNKVVIVLGEWDTAAHLLWISNNPRKRPASAGQRKAIRHYYGNGNFCEENGKNRFSEVKLRCIENPNLRHSMAIYVLEPKTCQYEVVVESPLLCPIVNQANNDGLVIEPKI